MVKSKTTIDHEQIRDWVEERTGKPAKLQLDLDQEEIIIDDNNTLLRIKFGDEKENLVEITWGEFFDQFEKDNVAFLYEEKTSDQKLSRVCKFVDRNDKLGEEDVKNELEA